MFQVLFRERGILSFFHAGKMTTHREKIPRFRCGYFRPCAFVWAGWAGFQCDVWLFPECVLSLNRASFWCERCHVKIPHFRRGYFRTVCVCCVRQWCENSTFALWLFPACVVVLAFVWCLGWALDRSFCCVAFPNCVLQRMCAHAPHLYMSMPNQISSSFVLWVSTFGRTWACHTK